MDRKRLLKWVLRAAGLFEMTAFFAVVMPRAWMEQSHEWLGMGPMPEGAVLMFMIRQASYTYGMHGIGQWVLSTNVARFRPLIAFNGLSYLIAGPIFLAIDHTAGMPLFWTIFDSVCCGVYGVLLLWLTRGITYEQAER